MHDIESTTGFRRRPKDLSRRLLAVCSTHSAFSLEPGDSAGRIHIGIGAMQYGFKSCHRSTSVCDHDDLSSPDAVYQRAEPILSLRDTGSLASGHYSSLNEAIHAEK